MSDASTREPLVRATLPDDRMLYRVDDALDFLAAAAHPGCNEGEALAPALRYHVTREQYEELFAQAAQRGDVEVLNATTLTPNTLPIGDGLLRSVIARDDLQRFARDFLRIELSRPSVGAAPAPPPEPTAASGTVVDWERMARDAARQIIERDRKQDWFPSQKLVADEVARDLRERGIFGPSGKPLTGATIKRHALKGITAGVSTRPKRGK